MKTDFTNAQLLDNATIISVRPCGRHAHRVTGLDVKGEKIQRDIFDIHRVQALIKHHRLIFHEWEFEDRRYMAACNPDHILYAVGKKGYNGAGNDRTELRLKGGVSLDMPGSLEEFSERYGLTSGFTIVRGPRDPDLTEYDVAVAAKKVREVSAIPEEWLWNKRGAETAVAFEEAGDTVLYVLGSAEENRALLPETVSPEFPSLVRSAVG